MCEAQSAMGFRHNVRPQSTSLGPVGALDWMSADSAARVGVTATRKSIATPSGPISYLETSDGPVAQTSRLCRSGVANRSLHVAFGS